MRCFITDIRLEDIQPMVKTIGPKKFAASQIITWLYRERVSSFDEMTNISKDTRALLKKKYAIDAVSVDKILEAKDSTKKYLCRAGDGSAVECVFIPNEDKRNTVCISTQVGCAMGCAFCRTGNMGFKRDLTQGEILGQLILVMREQSEPVTNVVLMGMGEPLANLDAVSGAVEILLDSRAFALSRRRVTLSTCGVLPGLKEFVSKFDIKIAISLNAATDEVRTKLMPINKKYPIADIMSFSREYSKKSRYRITFEYILMRGINDSMEDVKRLASLLRGVNAKVNLIPYNPHEGSPFKAPDPSTAQNLSDYLREHHIQSNVRKSRGQEIMAACGQLATKDKAD